MTAFAGIVTFDGAPSDKQTEERIGRAITAIGPGPVHARRTDGALFMQRAAAATPAGKAEPPSLTISNNRILYAAQARLDNRTELAAALAIAPPERAIIPDSALLLRMYQRNGEVGLARCVGAFSFALWDAQARRLTLARDCLGNRALFFYRGRGFVAFASTLAALLALPGVPCEIDERAVANFLAVNVRETRQTFFRGIERVPSRTIATIDSANVSFRQYWAPDLDAPPPFRRDEDYVERARELLDQAVADATSDTRHIGISTSGGLDSSAIAATAARLGRAERISCYTLVPPAGTTIDVGPTRYLDESDKMAALARMYPSLDVRLIAPEASHPLEQNDTRLFARAGMPVMNAPNLGSITYIYDAIAAAGHRSMVVGNYGNFGLSWSGSYSLRALLGAGQWKSFAREFAAVARHDGRGLARTFAGEIVMPVLPGQLRRLIHRLQGHDPDDVTRYCALNQGYVAAGHLQSLWREQAFDPWFATHDLNAARRRAYLMFGHNQCGRDFHATSEEMFGFDTRDPLADRRLLEFLLAVPEPLYRRNGVPRSFARAVLADRLPPEILQERRRGANGVTWFRRLDARRNDMAADLARMEASPLTRRLIDLPRLHTLMKKWPQDEHAAEPRRKEFKLMLSRAIHVGRFIQWVEGGNA
jgi:asparagine synthase (glutamine-hydrolysing)